MGMNSGNAPATGFGSMASPQIARAAEQAKANLSAKGGQPPTPAAGQFGGPAVSNAVQNAAQLGLGSSGMAGNIAPSAQNTMQAQVVPPGQTMGDLGSAMAGSPAQLYGKSGRQSPQRLSQGLQQQEAMQQAANQMGKGGQPPTPAMQNAVQQAAQSGLGNMQQPDYSQQAANAASAINSGMTSGPQVGQVNPASAQLSSTPTGMQQRAGMRPRMRRGRYIG